jgi:cysteine desulfuration protein SufE
MTDYPDKLARLIDAFDRLTEREDRMQLLIDYADRFQEIPADLASRPYPAENQVPFCESEVYVWLKENADRTIKLYFAVENPHGISAKALATILDQTLSGLPAGEVASISADLVYRIFGGNISMGKGQGLRAMIAMIQARAQQMSI